MRVSTLLVTALLGVAVLAGALPLAAAQQGQQGAQQAPVETPEGPTEVAADVDEDVRILDYGLEGGGGTFWLTVENRGVRSSKVTVTEAVSRDSEGSGRFGIEELRVGADETVRIEVAVNPDRDTKGVMVTTSKSINQGHGADLWIDDSEPLFDFGANWNLVRVAYLGGVLTVLAALLGGAWWLVSARREDVEDADLDPDQTMWGALK